MEKSRDSGMKILKYSKVLILFLVVFLLSCSEKIYETQSEYLPGVRVPEGEGPRRFSREEYNKGVQGLAVEFPIYPEAKNINERYNEFKKVYNKSVEYDILCKKDISKKILEFYKKEFKKAGFERDKKKGRYNRWYGGTSDRFGKRISTLLKWQQKKGSFNVRLQLSKYFNKQSDEVEKIRVLLVMSNGYITRAEKEKGWKPTKKMIAESSLFGRAFESYLTKDYEQALILSRKLYKSDPDQKRIKDLYYKSLEKLAVAHEEKQDYTIALDYIKEAEKIDNTQQLKEIKKRILEKSPNESLEKKGDVN